MGQPIVQMDGVAVRYGSVSALAEIDLAVTDGERIALVGPSGAGKTTLLNLLSGLAVASTGRVEVFGVAPGSLGGRALRRHRARIGTVGQHLDLALPLRVVHNVNAGMLGRWSTPASLWSLIRPLARPEVGAVLEQVGLGDRIDARTDELSGGERQRVAVARVLRQQPDLILADEPTSSVDPRLSDVIMSLLCGPVEVDEDDRSAARALTRTLIVSAHDPALARRHVDRMIGLRAGRIVFDRPAAEVGDRLLAELYHDEPGSLAAAGDSVGPAGSVGGSR